MTARRPIRVLDPTLAARIAAGEVIERPASAAKELIENALDAGARRVTVEIEDGGLALLRVADDGHGILPEELPLAFERHATSKVASADDLERVATLGFRGEALPSIAAVAEVEITSQPGDASLGASLRMVAGKPVSLDRASSVVGTVVTARNLFAAVPARRKFLRSPAAEGALVREVVGRYALACPEIQFCLVAEGRQILQTSGTGDERDVAAAIYGVEVARSLLAVGSPGKTPQPAPPAGESATGTASVQVRGYVSPPGLTRPRRDGYSLFVNRRWVQDHSLIRAVEEAYATLLPLRRYPIAVLYVDLLPDRVDVNVHPAKMEVRFADEAAVVAQVRRAVYHALVGQLPIAAVLREGGQPLAGQQRRLALRERGPRWVFPQGEDEPGDEQVESIPRLRVFGQLGRTFILAEGPGGLYVVDQHRAHERVLFERLKALRRSEQGSQFLLDGVVVELSARQVEMIGRKADELEGLGFVVEPFGRSAAIVRTVPAMLSTQPQLDEFLASVLRDLLDAPLAEWEDRMLASIACRSAIRAGQRLGRDEMRELLALLDQTEFPETCPHAAPILAHVSQRNIERHFRR